MKRIVGISGQLNSGKDTAADHFVDEFGFIKIPLAAPMKRYAQIVFGMSLESLWGPSHLRNLVDPRFSMSSPDLFVDDAWGATFYRAKHYNEKFVEDLIPGSNTAYKQRACELLNAWLVNFSKEYESQVSARVLLQSLGTEWGRAFDEDLWINYALRSSKILLAGRGSWSGSEVVLDGHASPVEGIVISDVRFENELKRIKQEEGFLIRIKRPETDANAVVEGIADHVSETEQERFTDDMFNHVIVNDDSKESLLKSVNVAGLVLTGQQK